MQESGTKESKKRGRQSPEKKDKKEDGEVAAKRGRGRPKGSVKKGGKSKTKVRRWLLNKLDCLLLKETAKAIIRLWT